MRKEVLIAVRTKIPQGATRADVKKFVKDALESWGGSLEPPNAYGEDSPGDPMFYSLEVKSVKITGVS